MKLSKALGCALEIPLIAAPMQYISGPELVSSICKKGAIGSFPTFNAQSPEELDQWLSGIEKDFDKFSGVPAPICPNIVMRRSIEAVKADVQVLVKHKVKLVLASVGSPAAIIAPLHEIGCVVLCDVASMRHAEKAISVGVDGLVLLSAGGGGQTGWLNGLAFARAVRAEYSGLIGLSGGISDGYALWAALALGCDFGVAGTRFIATNESLAPTEYKDMVVESGIDDIYLTKALNGFDTNYLKPSLLRNGLTLSDLETPATVEEARRKYSVSSEEAGPKRWLDIWSAGHTVSAASRVQSAAEVVEALIDEYRRAREDSAILLRGSE